MCAETRNINDKVKINDHDDHDDHDDPENHTYIIVTVELSILRGS